MNSTIKVLAVVALQGAVHGVLDKLGFSHDSATDIVTQLGVLLAALFTKSPLSKGASK